MKKVLGWFATVVVAVVAIGIGFFTQQWLHQDDQSDVRNTKVVVDIIGSRRPDFSLPDLQTTQRSISEWDGQLIVINFWATWCPPCREEIPYFIKLQNEFAEQGLQFLGIALQDAEEVREYVDEIGMNYPVLTGYREVIKIAELLGNHQGALPYTVVVDRTGKVVFKKAGPIDEPTLRAAIQPYL